MNRSSVAVILALLLSACSGGGNSTASLPPLTGTQTVSPQTVGSQTEAQSDATFQMVREPSVWPGSNDLLYVGNKGGNSVTVYRHDATGNTAPVAIIAGPNTGINAPGQLSEDAQGNLYVANSAPGAAAAILVFAHGANGNVAPIRRLAGPLTGLHNIEAMTVDKITGKIFVVDALNGAMYASLLRFGPNATGNQAPFARSSANLIFAFELASDSTGQNVIEAHTCAPFNCFLSGDLTYVKQFANNSTLASKYPITGFGVYGVADDPTTHAYVVSSHDGIYRLAEDTAGYGPDVTGTAKLSPAPLSVITSDTCGTQLAVAPGPTPYTYVIHSMQSGCSSDAVYVYTHSATGNAAPLRILSGPATKMNQPYGIYEGT